MRHFSRKFTIFAAAMVAALAPLPSALGQTSYLVTVNTSSINGKQGTIDLQFNTGTLTSENACATITNFATDGTLGSPPAITGSVTGTLATTVTINNGPGGCSAPVSYTSWTLNDYNQPITFGNQVTFSVMFNGPGVTNPNSSTYSSASSFGLAFATAGAQGTIDVGYGPQSWPYSPPFAPALSGDPSRFAGMITLNTDGTQTATPLPGPGNTASLVTIQSGTSTVTSVIASASTITLGDTVTFTATVTPTGSGTPTGLVTFFDGTTPLGSATLTVVAGNNQANYSTSLLSAGGSPHSITAIYQGANQISPSTSAAISEIVNPRASTTGVVLNPTTAVPEQSSTATVTITDGGSSAPPGSADTFTTAGPPATGRTGFTSTLFADGLVLVAGGMNASAAVQQSAEIYSFSSGMFSATANLNTARTGAVAVLLPTGKVLVAGGSSDGTANNALNSAELFDPSAGTFTPTSHNMTAARIGSTATLLNTGKVLLAGGANSGGVLNSAEIYDPATDAFTATVNLNAARTGASATLLGTGKVLIAGGSSDGTTAGALNSAEVFNPAGNGGAGTFTPVAGTNPTLTAGRWQPEAALLLSGKVLIAGGQSSGGAWTSADIYDPVADSFTASNQQMSQARANGSAVGLPNGMVLLAGGATSQAVDLYDADNDRFNPTGTLQQSDNGLIATLLDNGDVLVVGLTTAATPASDAELYAPSFHPLGTVGLGSSEPTDSITGVCVLTPSIASASTCTSTVIPANIATSPHIITGTYPADAVHVTSNNTAPLTVTKASTTTTLTSSANPSVFGQSVTFTATVTPVPPGTGSPTGSVTFSGISPTQTVTVPPSGVVTFTTSALAVGSYTIMATYSGDAGFIGSTGSLSNEPQVVKKTNTTTMVTSSTSSSVFGQPVTFTATITAVAPGAGTPNGTVTFLDNGTSIGTGTLVSGVATLTTSSLAAGSHTITTSYGGNGSFIGSSGSLNTNPQTVSKDNTTTTVGSSQNSAPLGQSVTFTATVSPAAPGSGTPTGTVTFLDGGKSIGTGTLSGGIATVSTAALAAGNHTITTSYPGDSNFNGGTGSLNTNPQVIVAPPTSSEMFGASTLPVGGTTTLTITITNPPANTVAESGVAITDNFPAGLVVATAPTTNCGGTATGVVNSGVVSLAGGSIPVNSSCTITLTVQGTSSGLKTNTTGNVSSTNGGTGNAASASLTVDFVLTINVSPAGAGTVTPASGTFYAPNTVVNLKATPNPGYVFVNWTGPVAKPNNASTTVTMTGSITLTANFTELPTAVVAAVLEKTGPLNARVWQVGFANSGPGAANAVAATSFTLAQTAGTACTPVIESPAFPDLVGNMAPFSATHLNVTINFTGCSSTARFKVTMPYTANNGAVKATMSLPNQAP